MLNEQQIDDRITIGGRPDAAELESLKSRGFRTIVNLLTVDEPGYGDEELQVEDLGLDYAAVPVSPDLLDDIAVARFSQAIDSSDGPVAVHCKGGGRAGIMTLLHLGVTKGWSLQKTLQKADELGVKIGPDSPYREFFEGYIKRHSAGER
jgi:uncharacterized protein (TIGR01244 family)